jgi:hypothetical protein
MRTSQLLGAGILYVAFLRVQLLTRSSYASEVCGNDVCLLILPWVAGLALPG